jgi:hypothetical protein
MNEPKVKKSKLEDFQLFYEHTDDNRTIVTKQLRQVKRPKRSTASRR